MSREEDKLKELLLGEEPEDDEDKPKKFDPIFNVREEFVLWVMDQFPELSEHAKREEVYEQLESRKDEVYKAALGAVNHGARSTKDCARARLKDGWDSFKKDFSEGSEPRMRARGLELFVKALKDLSISLGGNKHYTDAGTSLDGNSFGSFFSWSEYGTKKAFIYRTGDSESKEAKYSVSEKRDKKPGDKVLIGEFEWLTSSDLRTLKRIIKSFTGPEKELREIIDDKVPQYGSRKSSAYGYGRRPAGYGYGNYSYG